MHKVVWKGERLSALEYYNTLWDMFLGGDVRAVQYLGASWHNCTRRSNETVLAWCARFDGILAELEILGVHKDDAEKKARAIHLIGDDLGAIAELYGGNDDQMWFFSDRY